jgi:hypothetical protein
MATSLDYGGVAFEFVDRLDRLSGADEVMDEMQRLATRFGFATRLSPRSRNQGSASTELFGPLRKTRTPLNEVLARCKERFGT